MTINSFPFDRGTIINNETKGFAAKHLSNLSWDQAEADLNRYGTLKINDKKVYSIKNVKNSTAHGSENIAKESVLQRISEATGNNAAETLQYCKLLHQDIKQLGHLELNKKFHLEGVKVLTGIEKSVHLQLEQKTFRVTHEVLLKFLDFNDVEEEHPENTVFAKLKTVVSGPRDALSMGHSEQIETKIMHTATYPKEDQARSASYGGIFDYFSKDSKSDIS